MSDLSAPQARRLILAAQGFTQPPPRGKVTKRHAHGTILRIGQYQLDSVSTVVRAHFMPLYSRVGPYDVDLFQRLAYQDRIWFEGWAHAACVVPLEHYPYLRPRMLWWRNPDDPPSWYSNWKDAIKPWERHVRSQLTERGPLSAGEISEPGRKPDEGWGWRRTPAKQALERLFLLGYVSAVRRPSFERVYDLTERIIPSEYLEADVPRDEAERELTAHAVGALGVATAGELKEYYRQRSLQITRKALAELLEAGRVREVTVEDWKQPGYMSSDAKVPRSAPGRATFLTPFDPLIWHRERTRRLFDFDYTIEIYVPEAKRKYGYYVLPFLSEDRLAARVDLKAERQAGVLHVKGAWSEPHTTPGDVDALRSEIKRFADFLQLEAVRFGRKGDLISKLR